MNTEYLEYFKSPAAFAEFGLLHTDGETRQKLLGVTRLHYGDEEIADSWLKSFPIDLSKEAQEEAVYMHAEMIAR